MAYIQQTNEEDATGIVADVYTAARQRAGGIANIIRLMSGDGRSLKGSMQLYVSVMKTTNAVSPARREMLATVVSNANDCYYWTLSHAKDFGQESGDEQIARQLIFDYRTANLPPEDLALCDYAIKLTLAPGRMSAEDVTALRQQGFSDEQITIAVQVISYFNYINRIANGLGVDQESWMSVPHDEWQRDKGRDYLANLA